MIERVITDEIAEDLQRYGAANMCEQFAWRDEWVVVMAIANAALSDNDPRKMKREHVTALEDAFMKLHGPKLDAPRNDTERGLLRLSEILTSLLP